MHQEDEEELKRLHEEQGEGHRNEIYDLKATVKRLTKAH